MDDSLGVRTTAVWNDALLHELQQLMPDEPHFAVDWYAWRCKDQEHVKLGKTGLEYYHQDLDTNEKQALWIFLTRSAVTGLVPVWTLLNHHNGLINITPEKHAQGIRFKASLDIPPGGTIHNSYGIKPSSTILRNYGFVEAWPQIWTWCSSGCDQNDDEESKQPEVRHRFVLFPDGAAAIEADNSFTVCVDCFNVVEYIAAARHYTRQLDSLVLEEFVVAARVLLQGLPTSVDEDVVILESLKAEIASIPDWKPATMLDADTSSTSVRLTDTVAAVEYRLQFKKAVHAAVQVGVNELKQRAFTEESKEPQVTPEAKKQLEELFEWVHSNGGSVADGVQFGFENSIRGLVAGSKGFKAGELIMDIPKSAIILPTFIADTPADEDQCAQVARLFNELNKGEESHWWKYLRMDASFDVRLVALWDDAALNELQGLPPRTPRFGLQWFAYWCKDEGSVPVDIHALEWYHKHLSRNEKQALWIFLTRSSKNGMIPVWDLMNHHNGLFNINSKIHGEGIRYTASVDIPPGGVLHNSYGHNSADQLFRDYGFVDAWPQIWSWCSANCREEDGREEGETRHRFVLFPDGVVAIETQSSKTVCAKCQSLESYQVAAQQHTRALGTKALNGFVVAARAFLEGLPTSVDEDVVILESLKAEVADASDWKRTTLLDSVARSPRVLLADFSTAVEYRMQFKQAVHAALKVGVDELERRGNDTVIAHMMLGVQQAADWAVGLVVQLTDTLMGGGAFVNGNW